MAVLFEIIPAGLFVEPFIFGYYGAVVDALLVVGQFFEFAPAGPVGEIILDEWLCELRVGGGILGGERRVACHFVVASTFLVIAESRRHIHFGKGVFAQCL